MPQNTSCLLALALAVGSALVAFPSQAQTEANTKGDITASSQSSLSNDSTTSNIRESSSINQNKTTNISQAEPSSTVVNNRKPSRERNYVYSRIGFGLKQ